ncbi:MAG: DUF4281 domain-containing protein [Acidobacteriaceae bacterium]|nr:DUF4281 domain-containing protein [Acidobacteriaceae bacterium]
MTPDQLFSLSNSLALAAWIVLIFFGRRKWAMLATGTVIPLLLGIAYTALIAVHWGETQGGFGSLPAVAALFANRWLLLAGWIHYLAFDLFIGSWQVRDSTAQGIPHLLIVPCLGLTFFFGPAGLLLYFIVRFVRTRSLTLSKPATAPLA